MTQIARWLVKLPSTSADILYPFPWKSMANDYDAVVLEKTAILISELFQVESEYAQKLTVAALDGIDAHGLDPNDWPTVTETVRVVVCAWVQSGAHRN